MGKSSQATSNPIWRNPYGPFAFWTALVLAPVSLASIVLDWQPMAVDILLYAIWSLIPPAWLFLEYNYLLPDELKVDGVTRDDLKYTQELVGKFWAALLVVFSIVLLLKYDIKVG